MGLDSVELVNEIEEIFKIAIPDREAEKISTVGNFYEVVWKYIHTPEHEHFTMERQQMEELVRKIISKKTGIKITEISAEKSITEDLGLD